MTERATSPDSIASKASFTASTSISREISSSSASLPSAVEPEELRHVVVHVGRSVPASLDGLVEVQELEGGRNLEDGVHAGHADQHALAAVAGERERLHDRVLQADHLEGHVGQPASGGGRDDARGVVLTDLDGLGGAELPGHLELGVERVDGHDLTGPGDAGTLDDVEPDAAAADHGDRVAFANRGGVRCRTHAGEHTATDQGRDLERHGLVDLHHADLGDDRFVAERAEHGHLVQGRTAEVRRVVPSSKPPMTARAAFSHSQP